MPQALFWWYTLVTGTNPKMALKGKGLIKSLTPWLPLCPDVYPKYP